MAEEQHPEFEYTDLLPLLSDPYETTEFKYLGNSGVSTLEGPDGRNFLKVEREAIRLLTSTAMRDIAHLFRSSHLSQLAEILKDPEKYFTDDIMDGLEIAAQKEFQYGMSEDAGSGTTNEE